VHIRKETGVRFSYGLLSGHSDIDRLLRDVKILAEADALLAIEGANEPNNWAIEYKGEKGGARLSWMPVALLHRDLYQAVKSDPVLRRYPVWATTETGAQTDNTGLQYLIIPENAGTMLPAGTQFADYANCHNYITHPSWKGLHDNQTWLSAEPGKKCPVDGLYGNFGNTWSKHFKGYSDEELETLPRVTTETGYSFKKHNATPTAEYSQEITEEIQAHLYLNLYLSQFKRGWSYTAVYLLKGRANEPDHEGFAFYSLDYKPHTAAVYMHNFTTILQDNGSVDKPLSLSYSIDNQPVTAHDLLLQHSDGSFMLVLWGERFASGGSDDIKVKFKRKYQITVYDPITGVEAVKKLSAVNETDISLTDHPLILKIMP
jgi:hypothetical protein